MTVTHNDGLSLLALTVDFSCIDTEQNNQTGARPAAERSAAMKIKRGRSSFGSKSAPDPADPVEIVLKLREHSFAPTPAGHAVGVVVPLIVRQVPVEEVRMTVGIEARRIEHDRLQLLVADPFDAHPVRPFLFGA